MKTVTYDGEKYSVGDSLIFKIYGGTEYIGTVKFGIYSDNEAYIDFQHLGFYVEYIHKFGGVERRTLPDIITMHIYKRL